MKLYPLIFETTGMTQDYLWGGDKLRKFGFDGLPDRPLAEAWILSDRPEDDRVSTIKNGELAGRNLRWLVDKYQKELLGEAKLVDGKFPLLVKLLDAKQRLSLQVHPPEEKAAELGGEPKTECWYLLAGTEPNAQIFAGLKFGVGKNEFQEAIKSGELEPLLHSIKVTKGDFMFLPSGRLHAIGAGCLILEIQQNSNTTYRVFDWNRIDQKTGKSRELHVSQALDSIDFTDTEPGLQPKAGKELISCPYFTIERWSGKKIFEPQKSFEIIVPLDSAASVAADSSVSVPRFEACLIPARLTRYSVKTEGNFIRCFVPAS